MNEREYNKGFLKEKFTDYRVEPPESVWTGISERLGGRNRRGMIIVVLSAAATIALAVTLGITFFGKRDPGQGELSGRQMEEPQSIQPLEGPAAEKGVETLSAPEGEEVESDRALQKKELNIAGEMADEQSTAGGEESRSGKLEEKVEEVLGGMNRREALALQEESQERDRLPGQEQMQDQEQLQDYAQAGDLRIEETLAGTDADVRTEQAEGSVEGVLPETGEGAVAVPSEGPVDDPGTGIPVEDDLLTGKTGREKARWIIGAALSPLYSFRDAEAGAINNGGDFESGMVAYSGGVHVSYRAAKRVAVESGLFFNKMGISIGAPGISVFNSGIEASPLEGASSARSNWVAITNSVGNIVSNSGDIYVNRYLLSAADQSDSFYELADNQTVTADEGIRQHLDYLELPLNVRYAVVDRTFELQLVGGMSANFLLNNYITMDTPSGTQEIGYLTNIRSVNYSGNAGLGMIYHLHSQISLRLEPRFRYFLNSVNDATLPATRPYSVGLYTGITYTF